MNPTITESDVFKALRAFLMSFLDCEVRRGLQNDVPMPQGSFVMMTPISRTALSTNITKYSPNVVGNPGKSGMTPTEIRIQLDFYGADAGDMAQAFMILIQDKYAYDHFPENIRPLYAEPPREIALVTGEKNYISRWTSDVHIQFNPSVMTPAEFADELMVNINLANGKVIL